MSYQIDTLPQPTGARVLVEEIAIEMRSHAGIIQAGFGIGGFTHCRVLAIGPEVQHIQVGDIVYFRQKLAEPVRVPDGVLAVVDEVHIYATQRPENVKIVDDLEVGERRVFTAPANADEN